MEECVVKVNKQHKARKGVYLRVLSERWCVLVKRVSVV